MSERTQKEKRETHIDIFIKKNQTEGQVIKRKTNINLNDNNST